MRKGLALFSAVIAAGMLAGADDTVQSGPQVGDRVSKPFEVRNCNGPDSGDTNCQV